MSRQEKILLKILSGLSDQNIDFDEIVMMLTKFGFECRIKGSHHIFYKSGVAEIINLQPNGAKAKPYQVKQVRLLIQKYKLSL